MVATSVNAARGVEALTRVRDLVEEYGTEQHKERLNRITAIVPAPNRAPIEYAVYQSEALAILFQIVGEHIEASKPKKRGRPRTRNKDKGDS